MFKQDTVWTPNIRTEKDESYQKGHPLQNSVEGVVFHHTAFVQDDNLAEVTSHFLNPKTEASAHVVIASDGKRRIFANPEDVAFHAGASKFGDRLNVNDYIAKLALNGVVFDERQIKTDKPFYVIHKDEIIAIYEPIDQYKYKPVVIFKK